MSYQMTINLTDQEYAALAAEAARNGKQPETFLREVMMQRLQSSSQVQRSLTGREFMEKLYREGELLILPVPQPLTQEEQAERERLAQVFAGGKPLSEMVMEDRGPY